MRNNFKVVKRQSVPVEVPAQEVEVLSPSNLPMSGSGKDKIMGAVADNFGQIIDIARDIVAIQNMKAATADYVERMEANRRYLQEQTAAYVQKMEADIGEMVKRAEIVRQLMNDYHKAYSGYGRMSPEDFDKIMNTIVQSLDGK